MDNCLANKIKTLHDFEIEQENFKNKKNSKTKKIENTKDYKEVKVDMSEKEYAERLRKEKLRQQKEGA